ncbi:hypothetical protein G6F62_002354 [Rhizopus arrhizus]|nr:hypothetical protein G6F24_006380 [Rhizopus arrhizus]KAG0789495.1 hypothetical protein G6F21_006475 [Rhizopus arrhizus]KAG0801019.1 hypothetical protein G6F22_001658 [Rhizopus arrhizus]KAG0811075.1 hypothetical protein G6F20_007445 [Rhizopus arrhizus]KAG0829953.1 hypothetical protein G6F19_007462 [Rhizopus arrhizus]
MQNKVTKSAKYQEQKQQPENLRDLLRLTAAETILLDACARKSAQEVQEILEALPQLNPDTIRDNNLRTPLHIACSRKDNPSTATEIAQLLIRAGSDINNGVGDIDGLKPMHMGATIPASDPFRLSPLLLAKFKMDNLLQHKQGRVEWVSECAKQEYNDLLSITQVLVTHLASKHSESFGSSLAQHNYHGLSDSLFNNSNNELNDTIAAITDKLALIDVSSSDNLQDSVNSLIQKYRLQAIAHYLNQGEYDIIALQEVWMWKDYIYIKETLESKLPFAIYFHSGTLGSGLVMFSRYPILSSNYIKFTLAGKPLKVFEGDFYVGKGCGSICIDVPNTGLIDVYTTHLQAAYNNNDQYEAQRITECWQIANAVRSSAAQNRQVILTGDFNSIPTSFCYQILKDHGFMTDSWLEMHQDNIKNTLTQFEQYELNASECIQGFGITCDSPHNSWTKRILKQHPFAKDIGDRLDYIFYRRTNELCCIKSKVIMEEYIPHTQWSYSDHFAVHSLFALNNPPKEVITPTAIELNRPDLTHLQESTLQGIIALIQSDLTKSSQSSKRLMIIFLIRLMTKAN